MNRYIISAAVWLCVTSAGAQDVSVAIGSGGQTWPPAESATLGKMPSGDFHTGIVRLSEGQSFIISDNGDPKTPNGNKMLDAGFNSEYVIDGADNSINGKPMRRPLDVQPDMDALDLWSDKARYEPGQSVWLNAARFADFPGAMVRYRHGVHILKEEPLRQEWWEWQPPATDFKGYMVDVYMPQADGREQILASIGVDVSSDWKRFPRNGYTAWFQPGKEQWLAGDVAFLNRRHINAVQFQDWHWKHHHPYCPDDMYTDIANNDVSLNVVREFINIQHGYNMLSFFYNLGYGALDRAGAENDGVHYSWYLFRDRNHSEKVYHELPADWKSSISLMNVGFGDWQNYLADRNDEVYSNLPFDGFQVDQLGDPGTLYDWWGNEVDLEWGFGELLRKLKARHPSKRLIMNSVSRFGEREIASSGAVDVCYNEMWADSPYFSDLYDVVASNRRNGGKDMRTIFAAYMNYDYGVANYGKNFNTPGILLTDACIFALGAAHLELGTGYNMLCNEYFPNTNLKMDKTLETAITRYYDFVTAYENWLYDVEGEFQPEVKSLSGHSISLWNGARGPQPRRIAMLANETSAGARVMHLLNFTSVNSLSWRDVNADMPEPSKLSDIRLDIDSDRMVSRVWVASPDSLGGVPQELEYTQRGRTVSITVPSLHYWTMIVME